MSQNNNRSLWLLPSGRWLGSEGSSSIDQPLPISQATFWPQIGERAGLARVETARGLLLHLIQVNDGRVGRYVIVAPTEWNFHPQGAFVREIIGCPAASLTEAESAACRLALALDPCVAYEVEVKRVANNA